MNILYGDIGGTKTLLQVATAEPGHINIIGEQHFTSASYSEFDAILDEFLTQQSIERIESACFAVAGPVLGNDERQSARITNLPWHMDSAQLAERFQIDSIALVNDFEAVGYGLERLGGNDLAIIQEGKTAPHHNKVIVGAGTGLGLAQLIWAGDRYLVVATEGGHADFAPANEQQIELARYFIHQYGRCSVEFVLSGPGLANIYTFLCAQHKQLQSEQYKQILESADPAATIARKALLETDALANEALELFIQIYGSQSGNFALSSLALGGVYLAGGIAPKMIERLRSETFTAAFNHKGKMSELMQQIPVTAIMNTNVGLLGAQSIAIKRTTISVGG